MNTETCVCMHWKRFDMQIRELRDHGMGLPQLVRCMGSDERQHEHASGAYGADACRRVFNHDAAPGIDTKLLSGC